MKVNVLEAKNRLSQLIKSALAGEEVIIANRGEPVARLVAERKPEAGAAGKGSATSILDWLDRNPMPSYARRTQEEIDATIEEERNAWD